MKKLLWVAAACSILMATAEAAMPSAHPTRRAAEVYRVIDARLHGMLMQLHAENE